MSNIIHIPKRNDVSQTLCSSSLNNFCPRILSSVSCSGFLVAGIFVMDFHSVPHLIVFFVQK